MNFLSENATVISGNLDEKSLLCVEEDAGPQAATWGDLAVKLHTLGQERCKEEDTEVSMDIEQLLYEASRLHDAVCLMNRITRD